MLSLVVCFLEGTAILALTDPSIPFPWEKLLLGWEGLLLLVGLVKVTQSCPTLCDPMNYTVHGILQVRILETGAFPFSGGSSQPRNRTQVSHIAGGFFTSWATREALVGLVEGIEAWLDPSQALSPEQSAPRSVRPLGSWTPSMPPIVELGPEEDDGYVYCWDKY